MSTYKNLNVLLNTIKGKRIPNEYLKKNSDISFLFDKKAGKEYPYESNLTFYDHTDRVGINALGEGTNVCVTIKNFFDWYTSYKPVGYEQFCKDNILRCCCYAYNLKPYYSAYLKSKRVS